MKKRLSILIQGLLLAIESVIRLPYSPFLFPPSAFPLRSGQAFRIHSFGSAQDRPSGFIPSAPLRTGLPDSFLRLRSGQAFRIRPSSFRLHLERSEIRHSPARPRRSRGDGGLPPSSFGSAQDGPSGFILHPSAFILSVAKSALALRSLGEAGRRRTLSLSVTVVPPTKSAPAGRGVWGGGGARCRWHLDKRNSAIRHHIDN